MRKAKFLKSQFEKMKKKARAMAKLDGAEICGFIIDNGSFFELLQVKNKSRRGGGFSFYFEEVRGIQKMAGLRQHKIVGTFHSHPVGLPEPGPGDLSNALDDSLMLIFDVIGGGAQLWLIKQERGRRLRFSLISPGRLSSSGIRS